MSGLRHPTSLAVAAGIPWAKKAFQLLKNCKMNMSQYTKRHNVIMDILAGLLTKEGLNPSKNRQIEGSGLVLTSNSRSQDIGHLSMSECLTIQSQTWEMHEMKR